MLRGATDLGHQDGPRTQDTGPRTTRSTVDPGRWTADLPGPISLRPCPSHSARTSCSIASCSAAARSVSSQSGVDRCQAAARRRAGGSRRRSHRRDLRPAARLPVRSAGEHDRVAARERRAAARAGLLALQRDARADGRDARRPRRAGDRPAGRRHAHLHLHLHDGQLPAWPPARHGLPVIVCDRPNPIGGVAVEGPMLEPGVRVVRRPVSDPDAARHDDRRAGDGSSTSTSASAPSSRS